MSLIGTTVWNDAQTVPSAGVGPLSLTEEQFPDAATDFSMLCFQHNTNDYASFTTQLPHSWQPGSRIRPHVHVMPLADPAAPEVVRFRMAYSWSPVGEVFGSFTETTLDFTVSPGDLNRHMIVDFGLLTPPDEALESAVFMWVVQRLGTDPADTYTTSKTYELASANLGLLSFDVHYQIEKHGSVLEFPEDP